MSIFFHHLEAIGWAWVALFAVFDAVAVGSAILAIAGRKPGRALLALLLCSVAAIASVAATAAVATAGLSVAGAAESSGSDPSAQARNLAEGISVAMNGTAFGLLSTFIAGAASLVCLVAAILHRSRSAPDPSGVARR